MDSVYDVFTNARNILYLGNHQTASTELDSTEINEDDIVQIIRKKFYLFLSYIEDDRQNELNDLLAELKETKDQQKIYYNIFRIFTVFLLKGQIKEDTLNKMYNDIVNMEDVGMILQPAIYIIGVILLQLNEREKFLKITSKLPEDSELILLRILYFVSINRLSEAQTLLENLLAKDSDCLGAQLTQAILWIMKDNNIEKATNYLSEIYRNFQITPKIFNLIAVTLMSKGSFREALKPLNLGADVCQKNSISSRDLSTIYVNLITCYRNLGLENEVKDKEEKLRNTFPDNEYFNRVKNFEAEFDKVVSNN